MEEREQQVYTAPAWKKFYYPSLGIFRDIIYEQSFTNEADAIAYENMLKNRQWNIGGVDIVYIDDILIIQHPNIRHFAKTNGYYRFEYEYNGDWSLHPLDLEAIIKDNEEGIQQLQNRIKTIKEHPLYNQIRAGINPIYTPPNREQSNPLA